MDVSSDALARFRIVDGSLTLDTRGRTLRMMAALSDELGPGECIAMVASLFFRGSATGKLPLGKRTQLARYEWLAVTSRSRLIVGGPRVDPTEVRLDEEQLELPQRLSIDWPDEGTVVFRTIRGGAPAVVFALAFLSQRMDSDSEAVDALAAAVPNIEERVESSTALQVLVRVMMLAIVLGLLALPVAGFLLIRGNADAEPPSASSPQSVTRASPEDEFVRWVRSRIPGSAGIEAEVIVANGQEVCGLLDGIDSPEELLLKLALTTWSFELSAQETTDIVVGATRTLCPRNRYLTQ